MLAVSLNLKLSRLLLLLLFARWFQPQPDLVVTLRDAQDVPLPGIAVLVSGAVGGPPLASATTDPQGAAEVAGLTVERVAVLVRGSLPDGTRLALPGQDAAGIVVLLGPPPTRLELRVAPDGMVLPDPSALVEPAGDAPARMANPDRPISFPTASALPLPLAGHAAHPVRPLAPPSLPTGAANAAPTLPASPGWLAWAIGGLVTLGGGLVLWAVRRRAS